MFLTGTFGVLHDILLKSILVFFAGVCCSVELSFVFGIKLTVKGDFNWDKIDDDCELFLLVSSILDTGDNESEVFCSELTILETGDVAVISGCSKELSNDCSWSFVI